MNPSVSEVSPLLYGRDEACRALSRELSVSVNIRQNDSTRQLQAER